MKKSEQKKYIAQIERSKISMSQDLIKLPYKEKIRRVIEMQKMSAKLKPKGSKKVHIWNLD